MTDFLERLDPAICSRFIEFLIAERGEISREFHDRLAELYLRMAVSAKRRGDDIVRKTTYEKLLQFIDTTDHYSTDRLFGLLPSDGPSGFLFHREVRTNSRPYRSLRGKGHPTRSPRSPRQRAGSIRLPLTGLPQSRRVLQAHIST